MRLQANSRLQNLRSRARAAPRDWLAAQYPFEHVWLHLASYQGEVAKEGTLLGATQTQPVTEVPAGWEAWKDGLLFAYQLWTVIALRSL